MSSNSISLAVYIFFWTKDHRFYSFLFNYTKPVQIRHVRVLFWCLTYQRLEAFILWETLSFRPENVNKKDISNEIIFLLTRSFRKSVWLYSWYYKGSPILQPYSLLVGFSKRRNLSRETLLEENCPQQCYFFTPFSKKSADVSWPWLPSFHRNFQRVKTLLDLEYTWKVFGNQTLQVHL